MLPLLQCLHALSFGATHLGTLAFVARAAPPGLAATAQGYLAVALGVAMAAAMGFVGHALWALRRARLWRDGDRGCGRRALRAGGASDGDDR